MPFQITDEMLDAWDQELGLTDERQATPAVSRSVPQTKGTVEQALAKAGKFELTPELLDQWDRELGFDKTPPDAAARAAVAEPVQVEGPGFVSRTIGKALGNVVGLGDLLPDVEVRLGQDRPAELVPRSDPRGPAWEKQGSEISAMLGRGLVDTAKAAWDNGDFGQTQEDLVESYRKVRDKRATDQEFTQSREDWAEGLPEGLLSVPYSGVTMGASLLGALVGGRLGGKPGALASGMAASGATAYRASRHDFMGNLLLKAADELGRVPTPEEWTALQEKFDGAARKYGAWEAIPEAAGNAMFMGIVGPGSKWVAGKLGEKFGAGLAGKVARGPVGRVTAGLVGTQAEEQLTEGITAWGQGGVEAEVGLRDKAPTVVEAYKESFAPTFWTTMITGSAGTGVSYAYDRWKQSGRVTDLAGEASAVPDPAREQAATEALNQGREVDLLNLNPTVPAPPAGPATPAPPAGPGVAGRVDELADTLGQMNDVPVVDEADEINPAMVGTPEFDEAFQESQRAAQDAAVPVGGELVQDAQESVVPTVERAPQTPFTAEELQSMMPPMPEPVMVAPQAVPEQEAKAPWQMTQDEYLQAKPDGPKSRMNTHERHVRQALEQGLPVPAEVLERYKGRHWMESGQVEEAAPKAPWQMTLAEYVGDTQDRDAISIRRIGHAKHVQKAVADGLDVPAEVLDYYRNNFWAQKALEAKENQGGVDDRGQSGAGGEDVGQAGQGFQQDHGGPVGDLQAGPVQQDDQGQGGGLQEGSHVEDQSRIDAVLDYAENLPRHLVDEGVLTEEEAGIIEQAERNDSEARLADLVYEMSVHAEVRDHALDIHERVVTRIRKLGGLNYDHAREQMGRDGIQWMQSRFGLDFVSRNGMMLDELADMLTAEVPEMSIDREVQNLMDLLRDRVQSQKGIKEDYDRAVDGVRMEMNEILAHLQERQDYRDGKDESAGRPESDTEQANAPPDDPALSEFMAEFDRQLAEQAAKADKPKTLREKGKQRRERKGEPTQEKKERDKARANRKPGQTLKDAKADVAEHAQGLTDSLKAAADVFSKFGGLSVRIVKDKEEANQDLYRELKPHLLKALEHLKAMGVAGKDLVREFVAKAMEIFGAHAAKARPYFAKFVREEVAGGNNDGLQRGGEVLERDSRAGQPEDGLGQEGLRDERGGTERPSGQGLREAAEGGPGTRGSLRVSDRAAPADGTRGDTGLRQEAPASERGATGSELRERGDLALDGGPALEPVADRAVARAAAGRAETAERIAAQKKAADTAQKSGDLANIAETLPTLYEGQHKDVQFAELRFEQGVGVLFTNGTGTGKTGSGLGIVKRLVNAGKRNILISVPADAIAKAWVDFAAKYLNLPVSQLKDTKDAGKGVVITTHANMGMNNALASRPWDLIVIDESQKLMSSADGKDTDVLRALRALTLHPDGISRLVEMRNPEKMERLHHLAQSKNKSWLEADELDKLYAWHRAELAKVRAEVEAAQGTNRARLDAKDGRAGVVFLSATPFAYVPTVDYAEGYLFDYPRLDSSGYNSGNGRQQFFLRHFGYRMRYNKLTKPDANVDTGLMERQFNSWLKREKVLSSRTLQVDFDYDRRFVLVESAIGRKIDEGLDLLREKRFRELGDKIGKTFDHLARRYLLEAIKAREAISVIKEHLDRGRKVVIFHDYKQGGNHSNPFDVSGLTMDDNDDVRRQAIMFRDERPDLVNLPITGLSSPIDALSSAFPGLLLFNGSISKKVRAEAVRLFQDDTSGRNIILVQSAAGEAGISLHDTTGKHQRVLINLGLPTRPVTAMQQEGRIYRVGQASHAIFRYLNTGTSWERWAFASTIAERSSTAENLAMGEEARALKDSFVQAFTESDSWTPGHESEGLGGKERDAAAMAAISEWDRARTMYFAQQRKTARTKAAEGADYFATPEPLGLKMVEWAGIEPGMDVLEPSAGHGAIARWFPELARKVAVEQSRELASRLALVSDGKIVTGSFEDHHITNKYDAIVMNPPFGTAGKLAMEHVAKAFTHLREGGRIVALIPEGSSMAKRFDAWYESEAAKHAHLRMSLSLPAVTFERAGTGVRARVVVIDKAEKPAGHVDSRSPSEVGGETIKELFENLEHRTAPGRVRTEETVAQDAAEKASTSEGVFFDAAQTTHSKTGATLYVAKKAGQVSKEEYTKLATIAKRHGGWWSSYKASGAIPGFQFKDRAKRDAFLKEANELLDGVAKLAEDPAQYQGKRGSARSASIEDGGVDPVDDGSETVRAEQNGGEYGKERTLAESEPENERESDISGGRGGDSDSGTGRVGGMPGVRSVLLKTTGKQEVPARIESDLDAAVAVASLAEQPQENMVALVLDAKNKPLVILHHSKGATSSTVAESSILAGSVLDVPGARYVYLAHNHPGEKAELSSQDANLASTLRDLFEGSGVEMLGMLAVTSNSFANELGGNIPIPAFSGKGKRVPVQVRVFSGVYEPERVIQLNTPDVFIKHSKTITGGADSGIVLLNTQNVVVGFVPMSPQDMAVLRGNGLGNILKAMHRANANGVLGIIPGIFDTKGWHNVAALARVAGLRTLDVLYKDQHGDLQSFRGNGYDFDGGVDVFFSRADKPAAKGMPAADVQSVVDAVAGNWVKAPVVNVVQSVRDLPAKILDAVRKAGAEGDVQAVYHNGTVYIIADRMADVDHVRRTLLHEGTGHHGLRLIMRKAELNRALDLAWENSKVRDAAGEIGTEYELDLSDLDQRREAVEEVLANWAETGVQSRALDRFVAAVRRALRRVLPGLKMSDAEVRALIVSARRAVVEGKGVRAEDGGRAKMSRGKADALAARRSLEEAMRSIAEGADEAVVPGLRPDLELFGGSSNVTLVWGDTRKGLLHIGAKRGASVVREVLETVLSGEVFKFVKGKKVVHLRRAGFEAVLSLDEHGQRKTWLLTGWEINKPDAFGEVGAQSEATQGGPTFSRSDLVAGLKKNISTSTADDNTRFSRAATQVSQTMTGMATPMTPALIAAELEVSRTFANKIHEGRDLVKHQVKVTATEMQRAVQRLADSRKWKYNPLKVFSSEKELKDSSRSRLLDAAMLVHREMQINPTKLQEFKDWARDQIEVKKVKGAERLRIQDQLRVLDAAENLTDEQRHFVDETMNEAFDTVGAQAKNAGVVNTLLENYVRRLWNRPQDGDKAVFSGAGHAFKTFTTASKARTLETIFDGWMKGYDLQIKGITSSWSAIAGEIGEIVASKQFIQEGRAQGVLSARAQKGYAELRGKGFHVWVRKAGVKIRMRDIYGLLGTDGQGRKMYVSRPDRYWAVYTDKGARRADTLFDDELDARAYAEQLRDQGNPGAWVEFRQEVDIFEKVPLYAPEPVADLINKMTRAMDGDSVWKAGLPRTILQFNAAAKAWILMTSFFHHLAGARSWAFAVNHGTMEAVRSGDLKEAVRRAATALNPVSAHKRGLEKIQSNHALLRELIKHGLVLGELQDWSEGVIAEHRGLTERLFTHMVGRVPGAEKGVAMVQAGRFFRERAANSLFKRLFAGLKAEAACIEFAHLMDKEIRVAAREGRVPNADLVLERAARLVNSDFGGLHLSRMGRSPNVQAALRLLLLAPDWTESNWRTVTGLVPGLNKSISTAMAEVPGPPGMDKVFRRFWAGIILKGAAMTLLTQIAVSAFFGDDDDHWYDLYKEQFADWDTFRRMRWTGADVTPIYKKLGVDVEKGERKIFSVVGHFADFLRLMDPESLIKGKLSPVARVVGALGTKTDFRQRPYTGFSELLETGKTVKKSHYHPTETFWAALPSIVLAQARDIQPIQVGYLLKYLQGEEDGLTALLSSGGAHMKTAYTPDVLGKEYEEAAREVNRAVKRARELGELRAALLALDKEDPAAAAALRKERAEDIEEAKTFRKDNASLLRLYPTYTRVREALGEYGRGKRLQEAYVLDKNKRSTSVDTLDENIEKLKRTFVEKYRKAG